MATLFIRIRARVAQFAASHPTVYGLAAVVFAVAVGVEIYLATAARGGIDTVDSSTATPLAVDERAVPLPSDLVAGAFGVGDPVEIAVLVDTPTGEAGRLIGPARVLADTGVSLVVAVTEDDVVDLVEGLARGRITLVGVPD